MEKNAKNKKMQMSFLVKIFICFLLSILFGLSGKYSYAVSNDTKAERCYLSSISYITDKSHASSGHYIKLDKNDSDKELILNVKGKPQVFIKGICAWASSEIIYDISKYDYDYFTSYIGVDVSEQSNYFNTGTKFYIYTSKDATNWEKKYESNTLYGWSDAEFVKVELKDSKYLKLVADKNSSNWWAEWYDEAIYADAKLVKADYKEDTTSKVEFIKTLKEYDDIIKSHDGEEISDDYELTLLQREFVKNVGYDTLMAFVRCEDSYKETVKWLMTDLENLRLYILGGEPDGNYVSSLQVLDQLYSKHKKDLDIKEKTEHGTVYGELYKKMMITLSLTHSAQVSLWMDTTNPENQSDAVKRYEIYKDLHKNNKFVVSDKQDHTPWFEDLKVEEMRFVLNNIIDDEEILWLNEYTQKYINENPGKEEEYLQPHHYMKYIWPDYSRAEFHDLSKKDEWDKKYGYPFSKYGITYKPGVVKLWMNIEGGAVCGGISKIGSNIRGVHGTPSSVISQPGHAALIYYRKDKDGNGYWTIDNDVSGWAQSGKTERLSLRMPLGWGSDSYVEGWAASYIVLAQEALNNYDDYEKATELIILANSYEGNHRKQEELYRQALEIQPINIDAWYGLIKLYKADETKTEKDYYNLATEIGENLKCFPLPMYNLTNLLSDKLTSTEYSFKFTLLQTKILTEGSNLDKDSKLVYQPSITRTVASYLLGQMDTELAKFSFDGEDAGKIVLSSKYDKSGVNWDYSIDGKKTWTDIVFTADQEHKLSLTDEQIKKINTDDDIYVHIVGTGYEDENIYKIDITEQNNLSSLYANDLENRVVGVELNTQWRYIENEETSMVSVVANNDSEWTSYETASPDLTGNVTIQIRQPATGTKIASEPNTYTFTEDNQPKERRYVPVSHLSIHEVSTEATGAGRNGEAVNSIDGNYNTRYHSNWSGEDTQRYIVIKVDRPIYLSAVEFVPAGGGNGKIVDGTVYGSMDGTTWEELSKNTGLTYTGNPNEYEFGLNPENVKKFEVDESTEVQYIKIVADRTNGNWFTARMFNIFQDLTKNPHPTAGIAFSTTSPTNKSVEARLVNPSTKIKITNNDGKDTYIFTDNDSFTFQFIDEETGKTGTAEARVDWIDKEPPTATIEYSTKNETEGEVVARLVPSEEVIITNNAHNKNNNNGKLYTFTRNGEFEYEFQDLAGNTGKAKAKVNWIKGSNSEPDMNGPLPEGESKPEEETKPEDEVKPEEEDKQKEEAKTEEESKQKEEAKTEEESKQEEKARTEEESKQEEKARTEEENKTKEGTKTQEEKTSKVAEKEQRENLDINIGTKKIADNNTEMPKVNNTVVNKNKSISDNTVSNGSLPQTGSNLSIVLIVVITIVGISSVVFYVKSK